MPRKNPTSKKAIEDLDLSYYFLDDSDQIAADRGELFESLDEIIGRIAEAKDTLKRLSLRGQEALTEIPNILDECSHIEHLDISLTPIDEIQEWVFALPRLRALSCLFANLPNLPASISLANNLEILEYSMLKGQHFQEAILSLRKLKTLVIYVDSTAAFPANLGSLPNLEELTIHFSDTEGLCPMLPDSLAKHPRLKKVSIKKDFINSTSYTQFNLGKAVAILANCPALESLELAHLDIGKDSASLSKLKNLTSLSLSFLDCEGDFFKPLASLRKLKRLELWSGESDKTVLPDIFSTLKNLQEFILVGFLVHELPPSLYSLSKLEYLEIMRAGIAELDSNAKNWTGLKRLYLVDNLLTTMPESVIRLPQLETLSIEKNCFSDREIAAIKRKRKTTPYAMFNLLCDDQWYKIHSKMLEAMQYIVEMEHSSKEHDPYFDTDGPYYINCLNAVKESGISLKYVDKRIKDSGYLRLCREAVLENSFAILEVDPERLGELWEGYYALCMTALKRTTHARLFLQRFDDDYFSTEDYIQICLQAALENDEGNFLESIHIDRLNRDDYERICWASILHCPETISSMSDPTLALCFLALQLGAELRLIPPDLRTRELCSLAIQKGTAGEDLEDVPPQFRRTNIRRFRKPLPD